MKVAAVFVVSVAAVSAFAPQPKIARVGTQLEERLADRIFGMDLFSPNPDVNTYGARNKKNLKQGSIASGRSYVPSGLSLDQYKKVRAQDAAKKDDNYKKNVGKAFKFQDFDQFYLKRGTSEGGSWLKAAGKGHTFAKTKYDFSGTGNAPMSDAKVPEAFTFPSIFGGLKPAAKKAVKK